MAFERKMSQPTLIICSGVHDFNLTQQFVSDLNKYIKNYSYLIFPTAQYPPYSIWHLNQFIEENIPNRMTTSLIFIAFSAGVVAAIGAALESHQKYQTVQCLIALDGWGIPLYAPFPIYRISHDYFTHWSSGILSNSQINFYAEPEVNHLDLWQFPHQVKGWQVETIAIGNFVFKSMTLMEFIQSAIIDNSQYFVNFCLMCTV